MSSLQQQTKLADFISAEAARAILQRGDKELSGREISLNSHVKSDGVWPAVEEAFTALATSVGIDYEKLPVSPGMFRKSFVSANLSESALIGLHFNLEEIQRNCRNLLRDSAETNETE